MEKEVVFASVCRPQQPQRVRQAVEARLEAVSRLADRCFALPAFAMSHPFEQPGYKSAAAR